VSRRWYTFKDCRNRNLTDLPNRTILKDRDSKPLIEELNKLPGFEHFSRKSRVETEMVKSSEVIFVDGQPVAFKREGQFVPVLTNTVALEKMPRVTVDMGAVPHVVGGADIMAPGIRKVEGSFGEKQLVVIVDEKHGKFLSVGSTLLGSEALASTKKGKVIANLHYVGDPVWETIKSQTPPLPGS
jgi:PUA-domain protein